MRGSVQGMSWFVALALCLVRCSGTQTAGPGTGSETTNGITAAVVNTDGTPAVGATVRLRRADYVVHLPATAKTGLYGANAVTNADGRFEIVGVDPGAYALEVTDGSSASLARFDIDAATMHDLDTDTLRPFGTVVGMADTSQHASASLYVQLPGLERLIAVDASGRYTTTDLPAGIFEVKTVVARPGGGDVVSQDSVQTLTADTSVVPSPLPSPWLQAAVGETPRGGAMYENGVFTLAGGGPDIWGYADGFHFVYQQAVGDIRVVARLVQMEEAVHFVKSGVMIRQSLDPASPNAMLSLLDAGMVAMHYRPTENDTSTAVDMAPVTIQASPPYWIEIRRAADSLHCAISADSTAWLPAGSVSLPAMGDTILVGLAVSSHTMFGLCIAKFDHVHVQ